MRSKQWILTRLWQESSADLKSDPEQGYEFGWESFGPPDGMNLLSEMVFITLVCGNVAFDPKSIAEYKQASSSDEDFEALIERRSYFQDQFVNMDW